MHELFLSIFIILYKCGYIVALAAWRLLLGPRSVDLETWSLQLVAIDPDLRAKLLPGITHDLELSCDG